MLEIYACFLRNIGELNMIGEFSLTRSLAGQDQKHEKYSTFQNVILYQRILFWSYLTELSVWLGGICCYKFIFLTWFFFESSLLLLGIQV